MYISIKAPDVPLSFIGIYFVLNYAKQSWAPLHGVFLYECPLKFIYVKFICNPSQV